MQSIVSEPHLRVEEVSRRPAAVPSWLWLTGPRRSGCGKLSCAGWRLGSPTERRSLGAPPLGPRARGHVHLMLSLMALPAELPSHRSGAICVYRSCPRTTSPVTCGGRRAPLWLAPRTVPHRCFRGVCTLTTSCAHCLSGSVKGARVRCRYCQPGWVVLIRRVAHGHRGRHRRIGSATSDPGEHANLRAQPFLTCARSERGSCFAGPTTLASIPRSSFRQREPGCASRLTDSLRVLFSCTGGPVCVRLRGPLRAWHLCAVRGLRRGR